MIFACPTPFKKIHLYVATSLCWICVQLTVPGLCLLHVADSLSVVL